jgi:hypothetical protein
MCNMEDISSQQQVLININTKMTSIMDGINTIKEKQEVLGRDICKIKEAMYNPDQGLYARLKLLEARLQSLESFKKTASKLLWITMAALLGLSSIDAFKIIEKLF